MYRDLTTDILTVKVHTRLWSRIPEGDPDECWEWQGARAPSGYGMIHVYDPLAGFTRNLGAHRLTWMSRSGNDLPAGMVVMHTCDNPPCCNPSHLRLGTYRDNTLDSVRKGRWSANRSTSRESEVRERLDRWKDQLVTVYMRGASVAEISRLTGISRRPIIAALLRYGVYRQRPCDQHPGVWWEESRGVWRVQVYVEGKIVYIGRYADKQDAIRAQAEETARLTDAA